MYFLNIIPDLSYRTLTAFAAYFTKIIFGLRNVLQGKIRVRVLHVKRDVFFARRAWC